MKRHNGGPINSVMVADHQSIAQCDNGATRGQGRTRVVIVDGSRRLDELLRQRRAASVAARRSRARSTGDHRERRSTDLLSARGVLSIESRGPGRDPHSCAALARVRWRDRIRRTW
jgi:hypothetical protein